jgi:hypothetical protein
MGMYCEVSAASRDYFDNLSSAASGFGGLGLAGTATTNSVSLEKAWHGLHYLLSGEVWEGTTPLGFLLGGGEAVDDDEESGVRWFSPEETAEINKALKAVTDDALWSRFDAEEMENQQIYPGIWDEDESDLKEEYLTYFHELKKVVASAAKAGQGLIVSIG